MRSAKLFTVSVAASLLMGAVAHASDAPCLPWNVGSFQRVSAVEAQQYPGLDRTSVIGTGTAASLGRSVGSFEGGELAKVQHDLDPNWTSAIGTGMAASLQR
jgi:hypothetical protein